VPERPAETFVYVQEEGANMLSKILRGAILATFAVGATVAQADVFIDTPNTQTLYWDGADNGYVSVAVTGYSGVGGQFRGYFGTDGLNDDFFRFFCIELGEYATESGVLYDRAVLNSGSAEAKQLSWLFNQYYPRTGTFTTGPSSPYGAITSTTTSGAMQLAVWEIMFEAQEATYGLDLTDGSFKGDGSDVAAVSEAQAMLTYVQNGMTSVTPAPTNSWQFYTYSNDGKQNYMAARYGAYDVPLPGTLALFGIGLAGLGLARRKS
jgi:hypothetical protein